MALASIGVFAGDGAAEEPIKADHVVPSTRPDATTQPTTQPAASRPAAVSTVTGIEGRVRVRLSPDQPWQVPDVGMTLGRGATIQTGPRASIKLTGPDGTPVTLDRLGSYDVGDAGVIRTPDQPTSMYLRVR